HFNGNDARGLEKTTDGGSTWTLIDVIGIPDENPGDGWNVAGVANATKDHTLVRKEAITQGNTDWTSSAGTNQNDSEWIVYPQDTFEYLGSHGGGDTIPPTLVSANATSSTTVNIIFSEQISQQSAETVSNYNINGLTVSNANLQIDEKTVILTTSEQTEGTIYTITINNVEDVAGNPVESNSTINFTGYQSGGGENDLLFSDYIEGSSQNKALEIYNGTDSEISLSNYRIAQSVNGNGWLYWHIFPDGASIASGDVWVITTDEADAELQAVADEILSYPSVVHFNGNDARGLEKTTDGGSTWTLIDVIGIPDENPGDGWNVAGVTNATKDHTLVRKAAITQGNTDWTSSAGTNQDDSEWIVYPQDTFEYLGSHGGGDTGNVEYPAQPVPANEPATITFTSQDTCKSVELLWNTIKGNEFKSTYMNFVDSTQYSYTAKIPGQSEGTIVYFYITASDTSDSVSYFPENAPKELYQYEYKVETLKAVLKVPHHTFCPALGEKFEIQFHSRTNDKIILRLYNSEGKLVNTFKNENSNGLNTIEWDGRDETWNTLPPGLYICHLEVIDRETGKTKTETAPIVIAVPLKD
ncbi:MAG: lamin tail domain-containing protein, partial [Candidatus Cloacimonadota bacterium]|nr:lamin tail domain-containing protein [Candidatus Cloacimonadota bacterium]